MSTEMRTDITTVMKWIMYGSISLASFLMVTSYNEVKTDIKRVAEKADNIEKKIIRIEYELKLRPE
jgi:hypothetical protein